MAVKKVKSIAEYAIRKWMAAQDLDMGCFTVIMNGSSAVLEDANGDRLTLAYDGASREVHIED